MLVLACDYQLAVCCLCLGILRLTPTTQGIDPAVVDGLISSYDSTVAHVDVVAVFQLGV